MLSNPELFKTVEDIIRTQDSFKEWVEKNGEITGRMMIDVVDLPEGIEIKHPREYEPVAFEASFDFYNVAVGIAIYTDTKDFATTLWAHYQVEEAELPDHTWVSFFLEKLIDAIHDDGSYGWPIYSMVNDTADITVVPDGPR